MYVKNVMKTNVITVFPDASVSLAFQIMREAKVKNLPVVDNGKLVGIVSESQLNEFAPSKATSLSVFEINYILGGTKVEQVMNLDYTTCSADMLIEEVAISMLKGDIHMVPVVDEEENLLAVVTRSDIIDAFVDMVGARDAGTRYTFNINDRPGVFAEITQITKELNQNITHVSVFDSDKKAQIKEVIIKLDSQDTKELEAEFARRGYDIVRIDRIE